MKWWLPEDHLFGCLVSCHFWAEDFTSLSAHCSGTKHVADRLDEGIPILKEVFPYNVHSLFAAAAVEEPPPAGV